MIESARHTVEGSSKGPMRPLLFQWPGHKHRQAKRIVSLYPDEIATYYEPFLGGGAVLLHLLQSDVRVERYVASDHYAPLIEMWNVIKNDPVSLIFEYRKLWLLLAETGTAAFDEVRRQFNIDHDPLKLFFLLRVTRDGRFVFRRDGRLYCRLRDNVLQNRHPDATEQAVQYWSDLLQPVDFLHRTFVSVKTRQGDLAYCDPPYRTVGETIYFGKFCFERFFGWITGQFGSVYISLDSAIDAIPDVPEGLFDLRHIISNGTDPLTGRQAVADNLFVRH